MKKVLIVFVAVIHFAMPAMAEDISVPLDSDIISFSADPIPPAPSNHFKDFKVNENDLKDILETYNVVSGVEWLNNYSHVAFGDRQGSIILKDESIVKWMVRPGGLATLEYSDGTVIYLAK